MSGGIGTCKNPTCMQTDLLLEDGYCSDHCRMEAASAARCPRSAWVPTTGSAGAAAASGTPGASLLAAAWTAAAPPSRPGDRGSAMTALAGPAPGGRPKPLPSGRVRLHLGRLPPPPHSRPCPSCCARRHAPAGLAGRLRAPQGRCAYLAHISPPYKHAEHYGGFTTDLPTRWKDHLAGGYDPETHRNHGKGARLLAAALHAGREIELVRVWYGRRPGSWSSGSSSAASRSLRAGARRSLKPLPALRPERLPALPAAPAGAVATTRFRHDPQVWDADREWDLAFPSWPTALPEPDLPGSVVLLPAPRSVPPDWP